MDNLNSSQMLPVGTVLDGRYRIEKYLASGGFGNTYVAFDTRFDCQVAVKEFFMRGTNHRSADHTTVVVSNAENREGFDAQLDKFRREAKRIFNMRNDHIVHVVDLFDTNGTSYYVMDLIEGESLKDRVKQRPLTEAEVRDVADQLLDALGAVHAAGFYHLDVKPGNIMMDKKGHCTLIDFGASKQMSAMDRTSMSASGMAYTPGYAPVEQESQRTKSIGPWTDFYAVGATLYNLLTGQTPPEIDPYDTATDSRMFDYPLGVSRQMQRAISQMMNPAPKMRPQNVEEMRAVLEGMSLSKDRDTSTDETVAIRIDGALVPVRTSEASQETQIHGNERIEDRAGGHGGTAHTQNLPSSKKKLWFVIGALVACLAVISFFLLRLSGSSTTADVPLAQNDKIEKNDSTALLDSLEKIKQDSIQRVEEERRKEMQDIEGTYVSEAGKGIREFGNFPPIERIKIKKIKGTPHIFAISTKGDLMDYQYNRCGELDMPSEYFAKEQKIDFDIHPPGDYNSRGTLVFKDGQLKGTIHELWYDGFDDHKNSYNVVFNKILSR